MDTFVTSKIHWNETNHFPYDTFLWKGIDGTEIFTQYILCGEADSKLGEGGSFSTYNGMVLPAAQAKGWEIYQQKALNNELLVTVGYGDGGGGVTREMLEMNRRMCHGIPGTPKTRLTTAQDALNRIKQNVSGKKLPKWFGELYLEIDYESDVTVHTDGRTYTVPAGTQIRLTPGESIHVQQYLYHDFSVEEGTGPVLLGEVSQCNDDNTDNRFNPPVGRFPTIEEDEPPYRLLCNEYPTAK